MSADRGKQANDTNVEVECEDELSTSPDFVTTCIKEELIGQLIFDSVEDAEKFYIAYAKVEGFDVRRRSVQKNGTIIKNRVWVCTQEGLRVKRDEGHNMLREAKPLTRSGCKATLRVTRDWISGKYMVSRFVNKHSHELDGCKKRSLLPSDKVVLSMMTKIGIKPSLVMHYLEQLVGGPGRLSFRKKTAYNWLNAVRAERIREGDINTVINNMKELKQKDDRFFYKYSLDEEGTLTRLFWCDGASRVEYEYFGDVLVFDSTYKTNRYLYPLVIFSGVNNHGCTCIFGACFLQNETIESYQWVLQSFLEAMGGKIPEAVLTDQDASMRSAILSEFVGTRHRICSWHLCCNVRKNIKNSSFCNEFCSLIDRKCSIEEFEVTWSNIVENHNLSKNKWVLDTYKIRERWAEAYFRKQFMCMMTTTQRAESVNALIKLSVDHKMTITDFLDHYKRTLQRLRSDFIEKQKESEKDSREVREGPLILKSLEKHALSIYTLKIFYLIRKEIWDDQGIVGENRTKDREGNEVFLYRENKETEVLFNKVIVDESISNFRCDCFKLESEGIPCRHIISTLKYYAMKRFPASIVKCRWLKEAGNEIWKKLPVPISVADIQEQRFGKLNAEFLVTSYVSSQTDLGYSNSLKRVRDVGEMAKAVLSKQSQCGSIPSENNVKHDTDSCDDDYGIQDPHIEKRTTCFDHIRNKTRGAKKARKQKCGNCGVPGHKSTTCELNNHPTGEGSKKYSEQNTKSSSIPKNNTSDVGKSTQNEEILVEESHLQTSHVNNLQHISYGSLPQFPITYNMQENRPFFINMQAMNSELPLYSQPLFPIVPGEVGMGYLPTENTMGPHTSLLWQQQDGDASGSLAHSFSNVVKPPS